MNTAFVGFGANLGDPADSFHRVVKRLSSEPGIVAVRASSVIRTLPVGGPADQSPYTNACLEIQTRLGPEELFEILRNLETHFGRVRHEVWGPRTIDLDLLLFGSIVLELPWLTVPHPRMHFRRFVLEPLTELAPDAEHVCLGLTAEQLLSRVMETPRGAMVVAETDSTYESLAQALQGVGFGDVVHCSPHEPGLEFVRLGGQIVGATIPLAVTDGLLNTGTLRSWVIVADAPDDRECQPQPLLSPAVDCRKDPIDALGAFIAALQPPLETGLE